MQTTSNPASPSILNMLFRRLSAKLAVSPWGEIVETTQIAPGIVRFKTANRGGYQLSPSRQRAMPYYLRTDDGWYEDRSESAGVAVVFHRIFDRIPAPKGNSGETLYEAGREKLKNWHPEKYEEWFQTTLLMAEIDGLPIMRFYRLHADRWIAIEALDHRHADVADGKILVRAKFGGDPPYAADLGRKPSRIRSFIVDVAEFAASRGKPFLVDPARHLEIVGAGAVEIGTRDQPDSDADRFDASPVFRFETALNARAFGAGYSPPLAPEMAEIEKCPRQPERDLRAPVAWKRWIACELAAPAAPEFAPLAGDAFVQIAETANDIIIVTTADLASPGPRIVYVNPAFTRLTGYTAAEAVGRSPRILQGPGSSRTTLTAVGESLRRGVPVHEKVLNFAKSGMPYWIDMRIVPLRDAAGEITHFAAIERDVTLDKRRLDDLELLANRDTLTGILNRRAILTALKAEIDGLNALHTESAGRLRGPCLAFIDVDHFKRVNDESGHAVGDAVLCGVADRLAEIVRRSDTLGRIGGEEFAVCMPRVPLRDAKAIAERLRRAVAAAPFDTPSGPINVTVNIGVAAFRLGDSPATLMARADAAMHLARQAGRDKVREDFSEAAG